MVAFYLLSLLIFTFATLTGAKDEKKSSMQGLLSLLIPRSLLCAREKRKPNTGDARRINAGDARRINAGDARRISR